MTTIDAVVKNYKKALKDSQTVLAGLEEQAREMAAMEDNRHDAELDFEDARSKLGNVASDKDTIKDKLPEAVLTGGDVAGLQERYAELAAEEDRLRERMGDATRVIDENTPDPTEVAELKAALHRFGASGGDELVKAVKALAKADSDSLRSRSEAAQGLLPDVDSLILLGALGERTASYKSLYEGHRQTIEHEERISPAAGAKARERLDYQLDRILARA